MILFGRNLLSLNKGREYAETAIIFQRVINVTDHFESYTHIEQISDLSNRVKKIKNELCIKVKKTMKTLKTQILQQR